MVRKEEGGVAFALLSLSSSPYCAKGHAGAYCQGIGAQAAAKRRRVDTQYSTPVRERMNT
jgi:hypothetical protein